METGIEILVLQLQTTVHGDHGAKEHTKGEQSEIKGEGKTMQCMIERKGDIVQESDVVKTQGNERYGQQ